MPTLTRERPASTPDPLPGSPRLGAADVLRLGLHGLRTRPVRALLSALGVAIGIAAVVTVVGIPASSQQALDDRLSALGTNLLRAGPGQTLFGEEARLPEEVTDRVRRIGPVQAVTDVGATEATVRRTGLIDEQETSGISVLAGRPDLLEVLQARMYDGTFLNAANSGYPVVVLGSVAAQRLGIGEIDPRQPPQVWLGDRWFTVVGILDAVTLAPEIDRAALVGWDAAGDHLGFDGHPTTVYVRAQEHAVPDVQQVLGPTVNPERPNEVEVSRPSDALAAKELTNQAYSSLLLGLGGVALLVGGVGVANTMVISVLERRREIGLRRALGATRRQIRGQFLAESVLLSALGGACGVLLGVLVTAGYALSQGWPVVIPLPAALGGVAAAALIGAIAGAYPAVRASRLTPTEALA
ncbi:ABC transporter permease [Amycolatopsis aidingensis]|uniref:ABC transporter permease n=1 Tax=Amycolatopsis aidingensis TaxID=2842453 RepID=UPI001C0C9ABC|nr:ABC transporter permease [Amycolatopsis aidingensis]